MFAGADVTTYGRHDMKVKRWLGNQTHCDICEENLRQSDTFYDGKIRGRSFWALMCLECWQLYGAGIGTGIGQEYNSADNVKIRG